jgi:hypothetical protein
MRWPWASRGSSAIGEKIELLPVVSSVTFVLGDKDQVDVTGGGRGKIQIG